METASGIRNLGDRIFNPERWHERMRLLRENPLLISYFIKRAFTEVASLIIGSEFKLVNYREFTYCKLNVCELEFRYFTKFKHKWVSAYVTAFRIPKSSTWSMEEFPDKVEPTSIDPQSSDTEIIIPPSFVRVSTGEPLYGLIIEGREIKAIRYDEPEEQFGVIALPRDDSKMLLLDREDMRDINLEDFSSIVQVPILATGSKFREMLNANRTLSSILPSCGILQINGNEDVFIIYPCKMMEGHIRGYSIPLKIFDQALNLLSKYKDYRFAVLETGRIGLVINSKGEAHSFGMQHVRKMWYRVRCRV